MFRRKVFDSSDDMSVQTPSTHKSRKPPNTAFRQQRLKAWQPILTPKSVIPLLFVLAAIFAPLGIAIFYTTYNVHNLVVDYSACGSLPGTDFVAVPSDRTDWHFRGTSTNPDFKWRVVNETDAAGDLVQTCYLQFTLPVDLEPPLFLYYSLTKFYQNHRKYVESYDLYQLGGKAVPAKSLLKTCAPLRTRDDKPIYPCGLIANSFFNDTFSSPVLLNAKSGSNNETYIMASDDITWRSDVKRRFMRTEYRPEDVVPPPDWAKMFPQGYNLTNMPDLGQWQHLQNWMRTAALPTFFKLYSKNTTAQLSSGTYEVQIGLNYPVSVFGGTKSLVITTNSILGGRNMSLGIIYFAVAVLCLVCGIVFFLQYLIKPRRMGEHNFLQVLRDGPTNFREQL